VDFLQASALAVEGTSALTAWAVARRRPDYKPPAVALTTLFALGVLGVPLDMNALLPPRAEPWTGWHLWLVYVDGAIKLASSAVVVGLAAFLCFENRRRALVIVGVVWAAASITLAVTYPSPMVRGANLQKLYFDADLIGLFAGFGALLTWAICERKAPSLAHIVTIFLLFCDGAILLTPLGPWRTDVFGDFGPARLILLLMFATLTLFQGVLWRISSR
jgi:hypothetical protein